MTVNLKRICKDKCSFTSPSSLYGLLDCRPWRVKQAGSWSLRFSCSLRQATRVGAVVGDAGKTQRRRAVKKSVFVGNGKRRGSHQVPKTVIQVPNSTSCCFFIVFGHGSSFMYITCKRGSRGTEGA
jgi:hypothetical protein